MNYLARNQPCGCVVCRCEDDDQCSGCGAKNCGTHPVGEIPHPVYEVPPAPSPLHATVLALLPYAEHEAKCFDEDNPERAANAQAAVDEARKVLAKVEGV